MGNVDKVVDAQVAEIPDDDSDVENSSPGDEARSPTASGLEGPKLAFVIDPQIDINSRALLDMIADKDEIVDQPMPTPAKMAAAQCPNVTVDEAFDIW